MWMCEPRMDALLLKWHPLLVCYLAWVLPSQTIPCLPLSLVPIPSLRMNQNGSWDNWINLSDTHQKCLFGRLLLKCHSSLFCCWYTLLQILGAICFPTSIRCIASCQKHVCPWLYHFLCFGHKVSPMNFVHTGDTEILRLLASATISSSPASSTSEAFVLVELYTWGGAPRTFDFLYQPIPDFSRFFNHFQPFQDTRISGSPKLMNTHMFFTSPPPTPHPIVPAVCGFDLLFIPCYAVLREGMRVGVKTNSWIRNRYNSSLKVWEKPCQTFHILFIVPSPSECCPAHCLLVLLLSRLRSSQVMGQMSHFLDVLP